jgi:hypothetical protein
VGKSSFQAPTPKIFAKFSPIFKLKMVSQASFTPSCAQAHTPPHIIISKFAPESKIFQKVDNLSNQTEKSQGEALNEAREGFKEEGLSGNKIKKMK